MDPEQGSEGLFLLKHVAENGDEHDFRVEEVEPLGFAALRSCFFTGRRVHPTSIKGYACDASMQPTGARRILSGEIEFREEARFYGLVHGGVRQPA